MAKSFTICKTGASTVNAGLTRWSTIGGHLTWGTVEEFTQFYLGVAATIGNIGVYVSAYTLSAGATFYFNKNASNTFNFAISGTGWITSTSTSSCAVGDLIGYQLTTAGGTGSVTFRAAILHHETSGSDADKTLTLLMSRGVASTSVDNTDFYSPPNGYLDGLDVSETERRIPLRFQGRMKRLHVAISANARNPVGAVEFLASINSTDSAEVVSVSGGSSSSPVTPVFVDTTNTDIIDADSTVSFLVRTNDAGGGADGNNISIAFIGATLYSLEGEFALIASQASSGVSMTNNTTHNLAAAGRMFSETTVDRAAVIPIFATRVRAMECYVTANTTGTASNRADIWCQKDGVSTELGMELGGTTGQKSNLVNNAIIPVGSQLSNMLNTTESTTGAISLQWSSLVASEVFDKTPEFQEQSRLEVRAPAAVAC